MSGFNSQPERADPLADARAWMAHMEQTLARLAAEHTLENKNDGSSPIVTSTQRKDRDKVAA